MLRILRVIVCVMGILFVSGNTVYAQGWIPDEILNPSYGCDECKDKNTNQNVQWIAKAPLVLTTTFKHTINNIEYTFEYDALYNYRICNGEIHYKLYGIKSTNNYPAPDFIPADQYPIPLFKTDYGLSAWMNELLKIENLSTEIDNDASLSSLSLPADIKVKFYVGKCLYKGFRVDHGPCYVDEPYQLFLRSSCRSCIYNFTVKKIVCGISVTKDKFFIWDDGLGCGSGNWYSTCNPPPSNVLVIVNKTNHCVEPNLTLPE